MALPAIIGPAMAAAGEAGAVAGVGRAAASGLANVSNAVSTLGNVSQQASQKVHGLVNVAGIATSKLTKTLTAWISAVQAAAAPIESLVRVANPAIADAFIRRVQDAYGVVGRSLIPVMNSFTEVARKVGNVMAGLEPLIQPVILEVSKLVDMIGVQFVEVVKSAMPVIELWARIFVEVIDNIKIAVAGLGQVISGFYNIFTRLLKFVGIDDKWFNKNASAQGAAARQAQFVQPKQISDDAIKNALMIGVGQKKMPPPEERTAEAAQKILRWLQEKSAQAAEIVNDVAGGSIRKSEARGAGVADSMTRGARWLIARQTGIQF